jgi:two-component system, chemotaxis family, chemotaxis protein CheY
MKKVLIVDDAAFMRLSIRNILEKNGFEVIGEAENGAVAVSKYKELKPDIVTMDITMPEMTGIEALKLIMEFDVSANVVMLSAMGQQNMVMEAIMVGAKTFVVKPFKEEHVIKALSKL